jgi:hypothetical protein
MSAAFALFVGLAVGFTCAHLLAVWATTESTARVDDAPPVAPSSIVDRFRPMAIELARRAFLGGVCATCGGMPPRPALLVHFERGAETICASANEIALSSAHAFVEGARELSAALRARTGIDDHALDEAIAIALEEVAS